MADNITEERGKQIVKVSIIGIVTNALLAAFKAVIGIFSNSIAIVLDAVNNLSDALSSIITIVGTKLSERAPDRKHPFGYGRIEYLTTVVIAVIVLTAGATSLKESIEQILTPQTPDYKPISLVIVAVAVFVKIGLGLFVKKRGTQLNSDSLVASGQDALMDSIISASTLVAALIYTFAGLSLEAWLGAVISLFILKAGFEIIRDATAKLLGERIESDLSKAVKETVCSVEGVHGAFDLVMTDYGPQRLWGSIHIEVDDNISADRIDTITRTIQEKVYAEHQVILHTVGIYSVNTDEAAAKLRSDIYEKIKTHPEVLEIHGFYVNPKTHDIRMDIVVSFDAENRQKLCDEIKAELSEKWPDHPIHLTLDTDISD